MCGAQSYPGSYKPLSIFYPGSIISAEIEISPHLPGDDVVAPSPSRHAAGTDQDFLRKKLQTAIDQHSLVFRTVKSLTDNILILKKSQNILFPDHFAA